MVISRNNHITEVLPSPFRDSEYDSAWSHDEEDNHVPNHCRKNYEPGFMRLPKIAKVMEQIRKCNLKFDGRKPEAALQFFKDLEERILAY